MLNARKIGCAALLIGLLVSGCIADRQMESETNHAAIPDNQQHVAEQNNVALPDDQQEELEPSNRDKITAYLGEFHAQQLQDELKLMERMKGTWKVEEWRMQSYVGGVYRRPEAESAIVGQYLTIDDDYKVILADYEYEFLKVEVILPPELNRIQRFNYDKVSLSLDSDIPSGYLQMKSEIPADASFLSLQNDEGSVYFYSSESFAETGLYSLTKVDPVKGN
jgi:hypothetical protein